MTTEEIQELCDKVQGGYKTETVFPIMNRFDLKKRVYYSRISIDGVIYQIQLDRKVNFDNNVEL